jgi:type III pantothenate kinase
MIGNSRLHWGLLSDRNLEKTWDTDYIPPPVIHQLVQSPTPERLYQILPDDLPRDRLPKSLFLASVVPSQTELWQNYPHAQIITLEQVPLQGLYATLGIDRALALWGAGSHWGFPTLVIDTGTALTFTGANANCSLVGGAILPGLGLQLATLQVKTGQLPHVSPSQNLPHRYAVNTQEAIQSGVIYTLLAGMRDFIESWWGDFPQSSVVITGGDRQILYHYLQLQYPAIAKNLIVEPNLIFLGMKKIIFATHN